MIFWYFLWDISHQLKHILFINADPASKTIAFSSPQNPGTHQPHQKHELGELQSPSLRNVQLASHPKLQSSLQTHLHHRIQPRRRSPDVLRKPHPRLNCLLQIPLHFLYLSPYPQMNPSYPWPSSTTSSTPSIWSGTGTPSSSISPPSSTQLGFGTGETSPTTPTSCSSSEEAESWKFSLRLWETPGTSTGLKTIWWDLWPPTEWGSTIKTMLIFCLNKVNWNTTWALKPNNSKSGASTWT